MGWKINFPDGPSVDIDQFTPDELEQIAKAEDVSWWAIYSAPGWSSARLQRVIVAAAVHEGIEPPEPPATVGEFKHRFDNWLEATTPVEDEPMMDGFPPTPGEQEIGSQSGSPGIKDGLSTSPDDSPSTTSSRSSTPKGRSNERTDDRRLAVEEVRQ